MKKLFLLLAVFLAACTTKTTCLLAQFPPQVVYAGPTCTAPLPNYVPRTTVTGGCTGVVVTQTPAAGTMLTATNKILTVVLKATGTSGKSSQVSFTVTMADTITPRITTISAEQLVDSLIKKSNALYDLADRMIGRIDEITNAIYPWNLYPGTHPTDDYGTKLLVIASMNDSTGYSRRRFITYEDTLHLYSLGVNTKITLK